MSFPQFPDWRVSQSRTDDTDTAGYYYATRRYYWAQGEQTLHAPTLDGLAELIEAKEQPYPADLARMAEGALQRLQRPAHTDTLDDIRAWLDRRTREAGSQ